MTTAHDPMCPFKDMGRINFIEDDTERCWGCALIARVREDERDKREKDGPWFRPHDPLCPHVAPPWTAEQCEMCNFAARVREDEETLVWQSAESMVREAQDAVVSIAAANQQFGYAAALRDAVEAVKALHVDCYLCCKDKAIAAIEALDTLAEV